MSLSSVLLIALLYVGLLFLTAWWVDRRADRGESLVRNPYIYSLSLAVYCTAWTLFGSVGRASAGSMSFLAIYLGPALTAPLWLLVLHKMIAISKHERITSIADFISSRYGKSATVAAAVTITSVLGIIPYISIQLKAVSLGIDVVVSDKHPYLLQNSSLMLDASLWVTVAMAAFTILFGARKIDPNERHEGMVAAVAFESLVKLIAFFAIGFYVVYGLYDGFGDLFSRAYAREEVRRLFSMQNVGVDALQWIMLLLLSAVAIFLLPRQFHVAVVENTSKQHIRTAMWLFPLYLLLINIFVLPIAMAGKMLLPPEVAPDTYLMTIPMELGAPALSLLAFIGGLSAATGMVIVSTTAVSIMVGNHLVVPVLIWLRRFRGVAGEGGSERLLLIRRASIIVVLLLSYGYLRVVGAAYDLVSVGLISFTAVAQFAPAAFGGMYWKRATASGALAGLSAGFLIWAYTLPLPILANAGYIGRGFVELGLGGIVWLKPYELFGLAGLDPITHAAFLSLIFNTLAYVVVSLYTQPSMRTLTQADRFVNVYRYASGRESELVRREARVSDLRQLMIRFLGQMRTEKLLKAHADYDKNASTAGASLIQYAETHLAGAIGAASARLLMDSIAKEQAITLEEMMQLLEQTQEALRYSKALETKSAELEAMTRQLREANEQLQTLDRLKADFITTVTHELRTPVTSIQALSRIILDYRSDLDDAKIKSYLEILVSESERISRLINQVLDLEKIQGEGLQGVRFESVDMKEIVEGTVRGMEQLFAEKSVECRIRMPEGPVFISGNRDRMIQVVVNLLSNALKFAPAETGWVEIVLSGRAGGVLLSVRDNGPGIPEEKQSLVFEKFTQLSLKETGKPQGSGLGLYITKSIVEQHGGQIRVVSRVGEGACFEVRIG